MSLALNSSITLVWLCWNLWNYPSVYLDRGHKQPGLCSTGMNWWRRELCRVERSESNWLCLSRSDLEECRVFVCCSILASNAGAKNRMYCQARTWQVKFNSGKSLSHVSRSGRWWKDVNNPEKQLACGWNGCCSSEKWEADLYRTTVWFHPRSLFCDFITNALKRLFLPSQLSMSQSRTFLKCEDAAGYKTRASLPNAYLDHQHQLFSAVTPGCCGWQSFLPLLNCVPFSVKLELLLCKSSCLKHVPDKRKRWAFSSVGRQEIP